ncbi:hypothetical protein NE237_008287 [Protea cynaroides]|uniref:Protein kinase domain-containing protein n=1 Tax=Protea cynaroides TaxID=273540 RepID=A0A9Q0GKX2_9MAGN|nr:hypothetical protein NE237_008287 [Protea cynaroides]
MTTMCGKEVGCIYNLVVIMMFLVLAACRVAVEGANCSSYCGDIHNITYPFRLKGDPTDCGDSLYELTCETNQTVLLINSQKYFLKNIYYEDQSVRVVHSAIENNNYCPTPPPSLNQADLVRANPFIWGISYLYSVLASIVFVNCSAPVENNSMYTPYTELCPFNNRSNSSSWQIYYLTPAWDEYHRYPVLGPYASDLKNNCNVIAAFPTIYHPPCDENFLNYGLNYSDIRSILQMGYYLSWSDPFICRECLARGGKCMSSDNAGGFFVTSQGIDIKFGAVYCEESYCKNKFHSRRCFFHNIRLAIHSVGWGLQHYFYETHQGRNLALHIFEGREIIGILCISVFLFQKFRRRHFWMDTTVEEFLSNYKDQSPTRYSYSQIKKMTNNFKEKLGEGGFGSVFKGKLISGGLVAIKMLEKSKANGQDFINEVATIGRIHHVNIVKLIGFCSEGLKRALIYEFMPNGSLDKYIYSQEGVNNSLSWEKIYEIALGIARGIEYLHRGCDMQILHFDIKPHNILLDEDFQPKIADFGLAKFYSTGDNTVAVTAVRGTIGYIAPELIYRNIGGVSYKSDVYSFGMMLMEMASRRKNLNRFVDKTSQIYFPPWIYSRLEQGEDMELRCNNEDEKEMVKKMIIVALWCIQLKPVDRPSMKKVMEMLEGSPDLLEMPPTPFLATEESVPNEAGPSISMNIMEFSITARS